jgi:hypothetical protein
MTDRRPKRDQPPDCLCAFNAENERFVAPSTLAEKRGLSCRTLTWAIVAPFFLAGILVHDCEGRDGARRQAELIQACEQRAVDSEKARKRLKDERECRDLAHDSERLLGGPRFADNQTYQDAWHISYEKCLELRIDK